MLLRYRMTFSLNIWVFVYLGQLLVLSLALGSLTLHQPRLLMVPRLSRFLIGFCVVPFVIGAWMLFIAFIVPGGPRWLFLVIPSVAALGIIIWYGSPTWRRLRREHRQTRKLFRNLWPIYLIYASVILILILVTSRLIFNGRPPVDGFDALGYLGKSLAFAQQRSLAAVTGAQGSADGRLVGDTHGFLFPAFLSQALLTTGNNPSGYPYDQAGRAAFQVTFLYMLLSVIALTGAIRYPGSGALALLLFLQVPQFAIISSNSSRDAFRIIPLMLLMAVLMGLSPSRLRSRLPPLSLLPPLLLAAFSLWGHSLGGFVAATMILAWAIWSLWQRAYWLNVILVSGAVGVGLLLSSWHLLDIYLKTGQLFSIESAVKGTPLAELLATRSQAYRTAAQLTTPQRLSMLLERDHYILSIPGILGAGLAIALWAKLKHEKWAKAIPFVGLTVVAILLPFIGLFDYKDYPLSQWLAANERYPLHWYVFAAVGLAMLVGYYYNRFRSHPNRHIRLLTMVAWVLLTLGVSYSAYKTIMSEWPIPNEREKWLFENLEPIEAALHRIPGKRLLLEDARFNYYLNNQAVILYTPPTWPIIQARSEREVQSALNELNIGAVILQEAYLSGWWDQIPLFDFLNNPKLTFVAARNSWQRVYIVDETLVRRQQTLDEATIKNVIEAVTLRLDSALTIETEADKTYLVARTGQKISVEGPTYLAQGPHRGSQAWMVEETTRLIGPPAAIALEQGSLAVWGRLTDPAKQYSDLVRINNNNDLYIYHQGGGGFTVLYNGINLGNSRSGVSDDRWHHYVFTWQEGKQAFYIDGFQALSAQVPASKADTDLFAIGWLGDGTDREQWGGLMANLVTFERPLSPDEVAALYRVGLAMNN